MENESNTPDNSGDWLSETKNWLQDNIRIVLSIVIVLAIALGVYSYSKRGAEEVEQVAQETTEEASDLQSLIEEQEKNAQQNEDTEQNQNTPQEQPAEEATAEPAAQPDEVAAPEEQNQNEALAEQPAQEEMQEPAQDQQPAETEVQQPEAQEEVQPAEPVSTPEEVAVSKSGENYEVTAAAGDSLTTLARTAAKQYLDANNDPSLTKEHKIYIEDYLAHMKGYSSHTAVGQTVSFSTGEIQAAVDHAKSLTPGQLDHLKAYSQRVPNL